MTTRLSRPSVRHTHVCARAATWARVSGICREARSSIARWSLVDKSWRTGAARAQKPMTVWRVAVASVSGVTSQWVVRREAALFSFWPAPVGVGRRGGRRCCVLCAPPPSLICFFRSNARVLCAQKRARAVVGKEAKKAKSATRTTSAAARSGRFRERRVSAVPRVRRRAVRDALPGELYGRALPPGRGA